MSTSSPTRISSELFERYLLGTCSPAEAAAVADAMAQDEQLRALEQVVRGASADPHALWRDFARTRLGAADIAVAHRPLGRRSASVPRGTVARRFTTAAVVTALAAGAVIVTRHGIGTGDAATTSRQYVTTAEQTASVTLPDGSHVTLAPNTELRYTTSARGARTVELRGRALFDVTHDPERGFVVRTGAIQTRVLGTAFDVRWYPGDTVAQVAVLNGKVAVGGAHSAVVLNAGMARLIGDSATYTADQNADDAAAWTDGRLVFTNTPIPAMLETVGRWYGVQFRLADSSLAKQHVTATLLLGQSEKTLQALAMMLDVAVTSDGKTVTLRPRPSSHTIPAPTRRGRDVLPPLSLEHGK